MCRKCVCVFQRCVWIETCVSKLKAGCVCLSRCEGRQIKSVLNESDMFIASVCDIISFYLRGNSWLNSRHTWAQLAHLTSGWAQALFSPALSRWWWWWRLVLSNDPWPLLRAESLKGGVKWATPEALQPLRAFGPFSSPVGIFVTLSCRDSRLQFCGWKWLKIEAAVPQRAAELTKRAHWVCSLSHISKPMSMLHSLQLLHWNHCASSKKTSILSFTAASRSNWQTYFHSISWLRSKFSREVDLILILFLWFYFLAALHQTRAFNEGFKLIHALIWIIIALYLLEFLLRWLQWNHRVFSGVLVHCRPGLFYQADLGSVLGECWTFSGFLSAAKRWRVKGGGFDGLRISLMRFCWSIRWWSPVGSEAVHRNNNEVSRPGQHASSGL